MSALLDNPCVPSGRTVKLGHNYWMTYDHDGTAISGSFHFERAPSCLRVSPQTRASWGHAPSRDQFDRTTTYFPT